MGPTPFSMSNNPGEHVVPLSPQITQPGPHKARATHVQGGWCWWCGWAVLAVGGPNTTPLHPRIHCSPPMPSLPHTGQTAVCLSAVAPNPTRAQPTQGRATTPAGQERRHGGRGRAVGAVPCTFSNTCPILHAVHADRSTCLGVQPCGVGEFDPSKLLGPWPGLLSCPPRKIKRHLPAASTLKPPLPHPGRSGLAAGWSCTHV